MNHHLSKLAASVQFIERCEDRKCLQPPFLQFPTKLRKFSMTLLMRRLIFSRPNFHAIVVFHTTAHLLP